MPSAALSIDASPPPLGYIHPRKLKYGNKISDGSCIIATEYSTFQLLFLPALHHQSYFHLQSSHASLLHSGGKAKNNPLLCHSGLSPQDRDNHYNIMYLTRSLQQPPHFRTPTFFWNRYVVTHTVGLHNSTQPLPPPPPSSEVCSSLHNQSHYILSSPACERWPRSNLQCRLILQEPRILCNYPLQLEFT